MLREGVRKLHCTLGNLVAAEDETKNPITNSHARSCTASCTSLSLLLQEEGEGGALSLSGSRTNHYGQSNDPNRNTCMSERNVRHSPLPK